MPRAGAASLRPNNLPNAVRILPASLKDTIESVPCSAASSDAARGGGKLPSMNAGPKYLKTSKDQVDMFIISALGGPRMGINHGLARTDRATSPRQLLVWSTFHDYAGILKHAYFILVIDSVFVNLRFITVEGSSEVLWQQGGGTNRFRDVYGAFWIYFASKVLAVWM